MIAWLHGILKHKHLDRIVVDVRGVGYLVFVSAQTLAALPPEGEVVELFCYTHVREDALQLIGFMDSQEQKMFEMLIGLSGVGPKLALTVLSGYPVAELFETLASGNGAKLQTVPGIGKKTAERIVLELKDRCVKLMGDVKASGATGAVGMVHANEVIEALVSLGYKRGLAEKCVSQVLDRGGNDISPEALLRCALTQMREM